MKLQAILPFTNNTKSNIQTKKAKNNQSFSSTNSIAKNSLQEALGRSQVSFKGAGKATKTGFHYINENILGKVGEEIIFNDRNGALEYKAHTPQGEISQHMYFIPEKRTRVLISTDGDGNTTEQRIMPHGTLTLVTDNQGRRTFMQKNDRKGTIDTFEYDYELGRQILTQQRPGYDYNVVRVFTLEGEEIFEGELLKERVEVENGHFETTNIKTGKLYLSEKYSNKGRDSEIIQYWDDENNNNIKKEIYTKKGVKTVIFRNELGLRTKSVRIDKNGDKTFEIYAPDGISKVSKVKNKYDFNGDVKERITYDPSTDAILSIIEIDKENESYTEFTYNTTPNVAMASKTFVRNELKEECEYYITSKDKREIRHKKIYDRNNTTIEEDYSNIGKKHKTFAVWKENDIAIKTERYDEKTGILYERREKHPNIPNWFVVSNFHDYDGEAKLYKKRVMANKNTVAQNIYYHEDGVHVRKIQSFNPDRSYHLTCYDENAKKTFEADYNPDKTLKQLIYKKAD